MLMMEYACNATVDFRLFSVETAYRREAAFPGKRLCWPFIN